MVHPLNQLLQKDAKWTWTPDCAEAFLAAKQALNSSKVLAHYDPNLLITLAGDASAYGIGSVISHVLPDGSKKPIAFTSRTLLPSEKNYCQLEKEALSLVFGVKNFTNICMGVNSHLLQITSHCWPSLDLRKASLPWLLLDFNAGLFYCQHTIMTSNSNQLQLMQMQMDTKTEDQSVEVSLFNVAQINSLPVTAQQIDRLTKTDPCLSRVLQYTSQGWPSTVSEEMKPYKQRTNEITTEGNCLLCGIHVIIPEKLQGEILHELHTGISRMKAIAHSYVW